MKHDFMWATLVHLSTNMWFEEGNTRGGCAKTWRRPASPVLRLDRKVWDEHILQLKESGVNTIILDVGDGIVYQSHPEIAVEGAWTREMLLAELSRLDELGFEVIPKLNFSTTHDTWLGEYAKMVSTSVYYQVCKDLIDEVCELFHPRFLHLGMDEEVYENQKDYDYVVIRQEDLWWKDFYYLVDCVEQNGVRAMMWSDYARHRPDEFVEKCPKSVVQCVWYYFREFEEPLEPLYECRVRPFEIMEKHGYDQLPCGSVEYFEDNLELLAKYCVNKISKEHLLGFAQTTWAAVEPEWVEMLQQSADTVKAVREWYENRDAEA